MKLLYLIGIFLISFLCHLTYIPNGFTWLDHGDIESKRAVIPLSHMFDAFATRYAQTEFYRPIVTIIQSADHALYSDWAPGYHLTNVLLHACAAVAGYGFLRTYFRYGEKASLFGGILFGVSPLSFLPVGAIAYRQEILMALFFFLFFVIHQYIRTRRSSKWLWIPPVLLFLSLGTKETMIGLLPLFLILWEWGKKNESRYHSIIFFFYAVVGGIFLILRMFAVPEVWHTASLSLSMSEWVGTRIVSVSRLLLLIFTPLIPSLSDATSVYGLSELPVFFGTLCLGLFFFILSKTTKRSYMIWAWIWFLLPAANLVPLPRFFSPHYGYLASILVGPCLYDIWKRYAQYSFGRYIAIGIICWCFVVTLFGGGRFSDDVHLFSSEVSRDVRYAEGSFYLGTWKWKKGDLKGAKQFYDQAMEVHPGVISYVDRQSLLINQAGVLVGMGDLSGGMNLLQTLPLTALVAYNRAMIADRQGDPVSVIDLLHDRVSDVGRPEAYLLLAKAYFQIGEHDKGIEVLSRKEHID